MIYDILTNLMAKKFKVIVHPKINICWKNIHSQAIQDEFVLHWNRFGEM